MTRRIKAGAKPDAILYEPASKRIYSFNSNGGSVTIIDPAAPDKVPVTVEIGGKLEGGVSDGAGRVYVNAMDRNDVAVIDTVQQKTIAHWPVAPGTEPVAMAIDTAHHRLFVGCQNKKLIILSTDDGKVVGEAPIGGGCDGLVFDAQTGLVFSANGADGTLTVLRKGPAGTFTPVQTLQTAKLARTIAMDPKTRNLYLPCAILGQYELGAFGLLEVGIPPQGATNPAAAPAK
ncbi:MAG: YncE family protein [Planctomycetes bacterium]|nr:YncE family protein [Planctomycetota bacterium]